MQNQLLLINVNIRSDYFSNISENLEERGRFKYIFGKREKLHMALKHAFKFFFMESQNG